MPDPALIPDAILSRLNWYWITLELTVPPVIALLLAFPFWRKGGMIFGNIAGTVVLFGTAFGLIFREYFEIDIATKACLDAGFVCWPVPGSFTRFAVYAFIGLGEVFVLFLLSLRVERKIRDRDYAPEWR